MRILIAAACIAMIASATLLFVRDHERQKAAMEARKVAVAAAVARAEDARLATECSTLNRWNYSDSTHYALFLRCRDAGHVQAFR